MMQQLECIRSDSEKRHHPVLNLLYEWKKASGHPCDLVGALKDIDLPRVADM